MNIEKYYFLLYKTLKSLNPLQKGAKLAFQSQEETRIERTFQTSNGDLYSCTQSSGCHMNHARKIYNFHHNISIFFFFCTSNPDPFKNSYIRIFQHSIGERAAAEKLAITQVSSFAHIFKSLGRSMMQQLRK